jgi:hypothetical protein
LWHAFPARLQADLKVRLYDRDNDDVVFALGKFDPEPVGDATDRDASCGHAIRLAAAFGPVGIPLIAFTVRRFFIGITEVELGMIPLRLKHFGSLQQLPRLAAMR